jgi:hypothetical protein
LAPASPNTWKDDADMTSIPAVATNPVASSSQDTSTQTGGDMLAAMRPAMDTAFAVGRPTDAAGASTILGTGGSYLQGATSTLSKLDQGIDKRRKELDQLRLSDPDAAKDKEAQLDMLQRLRDRIQLSIERVSDILAGKDRDDIGGPDPEPRTGSRARGRARGDDAETKRREELELLEQRRQLLAPPVEQTQAASDAVASAYASAR